MKKAAVFIDSWKLDIFSKHLTAAGYKYEVCPGISPGTINLKVDFDWVADLQPIVTAANKECAEFKNGLTK